MSASEHFSDWDIDAWSYAEAAPSSEGVFKDQPQDFIVTEHLGYELSGEGENLYLLLEKTSLNTQQVCQHLAKVLNKPIRDIGYAGMKDKHAVTRQWFSIQMNVKQQPDLSGIETSQIAILKSIRHGRKLKIGALKANQFDIRLKHVTQIQDLFTRLDWIKLQGVPNYFGEQRFGFKGNNLNWANRMASGEKIRDRKIKGFALSAPRAYLFNQVLSERIKAGFGNRPMGTEVYELAGSNSYFCDEITPQIEQRLKEQDIYLTGPLFGKGDMISTAEVAALESKVAQPHQNWLDLLSNHGLKQERRALWLYPKKMSYQTDGNDVTLSFELPSGTFATSVIRECIRIIERENTRQ